MVLVCLCVEYIAYRHIYKVKIRLTLYVCWIKMAIDDDNEIPRIWNEKPRKREKKCFSTTIIMRNVASAKLNSMSIQKFDSFSPSVWTEISQCKCCLLFLSISDDELISSLRHSFWCNTKQTESVSFHFYRRKKKLHSNNTDFILCNFISNEW